MENLIKNVSLFLDKSNTSCMTLPSNGDTPPVFLLKMNASVLLGVSGSQFTILLHGEDLLCERHGGQSSIQVRIVQSFYDPLLKFLVCVLPKALELSVVMYSEVANSGSLVRVSCHFV